MERRELLTAGGALAAMMVASQGRAEDMPHHHEHMGGAEWKPDASLVKAAAECHRVGQLCLQHCLVLLGAGNSTVGNCAKSVTQMLALCDALVTLASAGGKRLPDLARVAALTCEDCEQACREHEKEHAPCHDCAESCAACIKECKRVAA